MPLGFLLLTWGSFTSMAYLGIFKVPLDNTCWQNGTTWVLNHVLPSGQRFNYILFLLPVDKAKVKEKRSDAKLPQEKIQGETQSQSKPDSQFKTPFFSPAETPRSSNPKFKFRHISRTDIPEDK